MARKCKNWLASYLEYSGYAEAPKHMRFWCGVSAIAGALRRKVWIDQKYFKWHANFYIVLVAPPGVAAKSTTAGIATNLLRQVEGVKFGPEICTWPALVTAFSEAKEAYEYGMGNYSVMSPLTLESSEFGNLIDPQDRQMVDLFVSLWDGKQGAMQKVTKTSGSDTVENPWINMIACTTPAWIAGSFPEYMIGGGFTSRTLFVWADKKEKEVAYPSRHVPADLAQQEDRLVHDLREIAQLVGEYKLTERAYAWGEAWYSHHQRNPNPALNDDRFGGYLARKQTHIHKTAIILAAAESDELVLTEDHLALADTMVTDLESDMQKVFSRIGRSQASVGQERLLNYITKRGPVSAEDAQAFASAHFPTNREYTEILTGLLKSGLVQMRQSGNSIMLNAAPTRKVS